MLSAHTLIEAERGVVAAQLGAIAGRCFPRAATVDTGALKGRRRREGLLDVDTAVPVAEKGTHQMAVRWVRCVVQSCIAAPIAKGEGQL